MATNLVGDFTRREERGDGLHSQRTPVLIFTGPRGVGKTALLVDVKNRIDERFPSAYIDAEWPFGSTREMLLTLAFELNLKNGYGTLSFPRLTTGAIVIAADLTLDLTSCDSPRQQIEALLAKHQKTQAVLEDAVTALSQAAVESLQNYIDPVAANMAKAVVGLAAKYGMASLLGAVAKRRGGRNFLLGPGPEWWGHQDSRSRRRDPLNALIRLKQAASRAQAQSGEADRNTDATDEATQLLWAAFLADLRENYDNPKRARDWISNCVLLLDNADTARGRSFFAELVNAREGRERDEPDPLTVVTTSRGGLSYPIPLPDPIPLHDASRGRYLKRAVGNATALWYPVLLPPMGWLETKRMVAALELFDVADVEALTTVVHAFTDGNLHATAVVLDALDLDRQAAAKLDLPAVLAALQPGTRAEHPPTVEQAILGRLLASLDKLASHDREDQAPADDLATCAAARQGASAQRLVTNPDLRYQLPGPDAAIFSNEFWSADRAGVPAFLHPLLRRLLLRQLASRGPKEKANWAQVHVWLRHRARVGGKEGAELYHTLALTGTPPEEVAERVQEASAAEATRPPAEKSPGHGADPLAKAVPSANAGPDKPVTPLQHVVRQLADHLKGADAYKWLCHVACVTAAPNRLDHKQAPRVQVVRLTSWADCKEMPIAPVARYVACSWLGADPLNARHWRHLLTQMASELDLIAPYGNDTGLAVMRAEARRYRGIADMGSWRDVEEFWVTRVRTADEANWGADTNDSRGARPEQATQIPV